MGKRVDITDKLKFSENPVIVVKGEELEVNTEATTILQVMSLMGEDVTAQQLAQVCEMIFTEEARKKIEGLHLKFEDYTTLVMTAIDVAAGDDEDDEGNEQTPAMTS